MGISDRLRIFLVSEQISSENYYAMERIISMFDVKWNIKLTEENGCMFITHLAMAYERIKNKNEITEVEGRINDEIRDSKNFKKSKRIIEDIKSEIGIKLPKAEEEFILLYLCVLLDNN
jgi:transcriptional regulatory protein LevR